jgi:hypothetical protein
MHIFHARANDFIRIMTPISAPVPAMSNIDHTRGQY